MHECKTVLHCFSHLEYWHMYICMCLHVPETIPCSATIVSSLSHTCSYSSLPLFIYIWLPCCGAEVCPTSPPTQHKASPTPDPTRGSSSEAPATLTSWSDPNPESTGDAPQGGVIADTCHSRIHACHQYLTAVGQPLMDGWR